MPDVDVHRIFDRVAHLYDTGWLQRAVYTPAQDWTLARLREWQPGSVLDVACGTGIFADRLARELTPVSVAGCDISAGMLAEASARSRQVSWIRADSARLPVRTGAVDAVVCTWAFHFFDQPRAWEEFRRVLAPGGHAVVAMTNPASEARSRRFTKLSRAVMRTRVNWPTGNEMRRLAADAGFETVEQHEVAWRFKAFAPLILSVARAPGHL